MENTLDLYVDDLRRLVPLSRSRVPGPHFYWKQKKQEPLFLSFVSTHYSFLDPFNNPLGPNGLFETVYSWKNWIDRY